MFIMSPISIISFIQSFILFEETSTKGPVPTGDVEFFAYNIGKLFRKIGHFGA